MPQTSEHRLLMFVAPIQTNCFDQRPQRWMWAPLQCRAHGRSSMSNQLDYNPPPKDVSFTLVPILLTGKKCSSVAGRLVSAPGFSHIPTRLLWKNWFKIPSAVWKASSKVIWNPWFLLNWPTTVEWSVEFPFRSTYLGISQARHLFSNFDESLMWL